LSKKGRSSDRENICLSRKQNLNERYGADIRLPDLREEIAQCERWGACNNW